MKVKLPPIGKQLLKVVFRAGRHGMQRSYVNPISTNLERVKVVEPKPFVSVHIAIYNEKRVVERLVKSATALDWYRGDKTPAYEVIIADDSNDETTELAKQTLVKLGWQMKKKTAIKDVRDPKVELAENPNMEIFVFTKAGAVNVKIIHRFSRTGFKGEALHNALLETAASCEYICIFDADFVPYPDTLEQFIKTFQVLEQDSRSEDSRIVGQDNPTIPPSHHPNIAAVQGYQWHVLNKSQTWVTRGVRTEYSGSYVIERSFEEIYGGLKQIAGSVYCIRADVLRKFGWGTSITEDFELTLRLYEAGYKVVFTPHIQVPAEAVSTIKRLIRQRMRWAEGSSFNIKVMFFRILSSKNMTRAEKAEFVYFSFYYLQAAFFVVGTFAWFVSETIFNARLPFWTAAFGWSLVFTNLFALPLMNIVGLFLEESDERDYVGILSFLALSYIVVPFQAYAAVKGFLEKEEGPWFRTPKTGAVTDVVERVGFGKLFGNLFGKKVETSLQPTDYNPPTKLAFNPLRAENFRIRRRHVRYIGNLALVAVIAVTVVMSVLAPLMPIADSYAYDQKLKTVSDSSSGNDLDRYIEELEKKYGNIDSKPVEQQVEEVKNQSNSDNLAGNPLSKEELFKNAVSEEINGSRLVSLKSKDGGPVEFIFSKTPKVRIRVNKREVEFETKSIGGLAVNAQKATIFENKAVLYEEIVKDIDLQYMFNGDLIVENFVVKTPSAAKFLAEAKDAGFVQKLTTVDVKVVSPEPNTFGFYAPDGKEIIKLSQPFAEDAQRAISNDFSFTLQKDYIGHKLTKVIGESAKSWLVDSQRSFPIYIDPSIVVAGASRFNTVITSTGIANTDIQFGGNQRKVVYSSTASAWYAFYNDDNTGQDVFYKKCLASSSCDADGDWGARQDVDTTDADNHNVSIGVSNGIIHAFWLDEGADLVEGKQLDTSSDTLGTLCQLTSPGAFTVSTYMVSVASYSTTAAIIAYSDYSAAGTNVDVLKATGLNGTCTVADVNPANITFGSGVTAEDRPTLVTLSSDKVAMVFQDGNLSYSEFNVVENEWTTNNLTIAAVTDNVYSVASDQAATPTTWILTANISDATDTNFYSCCTADFLETQLDSDAGANDDDDSSDLGVYCPTATDCKIAYTDNIDANNAALVKFIDCADASCSAVDATTTLDTIDEGPPAGDPSIYCSSATDCKVVYMDGQTAPDIYFVDCDNASCTTPGIVNTDADFGSASSTTHLDIYCPATDNCKFVYDDNDSSSVVFVDCADTECTASTDTLTAVVNYGNTATGPDNAIYCVASTNCKVVTHDADAGDVVFVDCSGAGTTETCASPPTPDIIDTDVGTAVGQVTVDLDCISDNTDCKVVYGDNADDDLSFVDCNDTDCDAGAIVDVDANGGTNSSVSPALSLSCFAADDCKILYEGALTSTAEKLYFVDCADASCSTGSAIVTPGPRFRGSLYCKIATDDCKMVYYEGTASTNPALIFTDCDTANCFPSVTDSTDPWQADGSNIETVSLTYDSTNTDLYAHIIQDASDQAYYKSTDTTISWSSQTSYAFTAGTLNEINAPERAAGTGEIGVVLNQNANYEASLPGNAIEETEVQFGGLQRKLAYVSSNWYAFYNDATDISYKKSSDGTSWGSAVDVDTNDADNWNPTIWLEGTDIYVAWIDNSADAVEVNKIDTASSDSLGTKCTSADLGTIDTNSFTLSLTVDDFGDVYFALTDTNGDTEFFVFNLTFSGCTFTDISANSGLTAGDRPLLISPGMGTSMIFQDGALKISATEGAGSATAAATWPISGATIVSDTDSFYDATTDGTTVWLLTVDSTTATDFYVIGAPSYSDIDTDVGTNVPKSDIDCPIATDCKIVYHDTGISDVFFTDCNDATCSSPTSTAIDTDVGASSGLSVAIDCPAADGADCKVIYSADVTSAFTFADCNNATCSAPALVNIGAQTAAGGSVDIDCPTATDCKVVYGERTDSDIVFVDCNDASCSTSASTTIDSAAGGINLKGIAIDCPTATDCKVVYQEDTNSDITFVDCADASCSGSIDCNAEPPTGGCTDIDTNIGGASRYVDIDCPTATDCKVVYGDSIDSDLTFVDCADASCSGSIDCNADPPTGGCTDIDTNSGGGKNSIYCPQATDCKISYRDTSDGDTTFVDCADASCSSNVQVDIDADVGTGAGVGAAIDCPAADGADCKVIYYDATDSDDTFVDCNDAACYAAAAGSNPWSSQTNITSVSITYDSTNSDLYAHIIKDTSEQAYWETTDAASISWSGETSYSFTAGDLGHISSNMVGAGPSQIGVVLRQTSNFEFAALPERMYLLLVALPFVPKLLNKTKQKKRVMRC